MSTALGGFVDITSADLNQHPDLYEQLAEAYDLYISDRIRTVLLHEGFNVGDSGARFIYDAIKEKIERDGMPVPPKEGKT